MGKLWLIEGLPGSGKTTFAGTLAATPGYTFYSEIDASHPVDVHDVYWVEAGVETEGEIIDQDETGRFIRYRLNENRSGVDVYELPFDTHVGLMVGRWRRFVEQVKGEDGTYVFECAFLQNPFTIGMVAQDVPNERIEAYIETVADLLAPLDPTVVYLETADVPTVFRDVYAERPTEWRRGFVEYYTTRAYAQANGLGGIEGTIQLLKERQRRELNLLERLPVRTIRLVNDDRGAIKAFDALRSKVEADHADA